MANKSIKISGDGNIIGGLNSGNIAHDFQANVNVGKNCIDDIDTEIRDYLVEIQSLLQQLDVQNPHASMTQKEQFVNIATPATKRKRLINALQEGGRTALKRFLDNAYADVVISILDGWKNAK